MKRIAAAIAVAAAFAAFAQTAGEKTADKKSAADGKSAAKQTAGMSAAEKKAANMQKIMEKTGGFLTIPGKGKLAVVDCQSRISGEDVNERIEKFKKTLRVSFEYSKGGKFSIADASKMLEGTGAAQAFFIIDDPAMPMSLVAPESRWGFMNVAALAADGPDAQKLARRFRKEFTRAAALTFGSYSSQFSGSPLQPVHSLEDFDKVLGEDVTIDLMTGMQRNFGKLGVTADRRTTYKKACFEGWAPAPTNQWQKAIYDGVKDGSIKPPRRPPPVNLAPGGPAKR